MTLNFAEIIAKRVNYETQELLLYILYNHKLQKFIEIALDDTDETKNAD